MTNEEYVKWLKQLDENLKFDGLIDGDKEVDLHEMIFDLCEMLEQQTCDDAVSREAAIDAAINGADDWDGGYSPTREEYIKKAINALPSVNPQPKIGWIPVSERLPKGSDIVLLSLPPHIDPDGEECSASVICGHYIGGIDKEWGLSDGDTFGYGIVSIRKGTNPIAWMPLPPCYEPQEKEES